MYPIMSVIDPSNCQTFASNCYTCFTNVYDIQLNM